MSSLIEQFDQNLDHISAMLGIPNDSFTFIFAGPPKLSLFNKNLDDGVTGNELIPIGGVININIQGGRTAPSQKFLGTQSYTPLEGKGQPETGMLQGLLLFSNYEVAADHPLNTGDLAGTKHKRHLLKKMYSYMTANHGELVKKFYSKSATTSGLVPVAYDDSDRWRNFARSTLFNFPIGLYVISKSSMGETLEASFYEGVRVQGQQQFQMSAVTQAPVYEQVVFSFAKMEPIDPSAVLAQNAGDDFVELAEAYLNGSK